MAFTSLYALTSNISLELARLAMKVSIASRRSEKYGCVSGSSLLRKERKSCNWVVADGSEVLSLLGAGGVCCALWTVLNWFGRLCLGLLLGNRESVPICVELRDKFALAGGLDWSGHLFSMAGASFPENDILSQSRLDYHIGTLFLLLPLDLRGERYRVHKFFVLKGMPGDWKQWVVRKQS